MKLIVVVGVFAGLMLCLGACSTPQFQTLNIFNSPNRVVALQVMPDAYGGKGFDHPVTFTRDEITHILKGVQVQRGVLAPIKHQAFSDTELRLFAPHFVKALQSATKEEIVTFFETAEIDDEHQLTTSGGLFVAGGNLYVVLSNISVKTPIWQDNEEYEASFRNRPLKQMDPQPGGLVFEPREWMVQSPDGEIGHPLTGKPWQVAIKYKSFLAAEK